jgi:hypothetical protein
MAAVFIDIPGVGNIEAKNAASEATLKEILKVMQNMNKAVGGRSTGGAPAGGAGSAGGGGGGGSGGGGGAGGRFGASMNYAARAGQNFGKMAEGLNKVFTGAGNAVGFMATGARATVRGFGNLAKAGADLASELANVGDSLTAAARSLNHIPVIGGVLSAVLGAVAAAAESVTKSMKDASGSGASFGGSLSQLNIAAGQAGMTMEQFGAFVKSNGVAMGAFGATTDDGAKNFARLSSSLRATSSDLYALGYGTADINAGLANYGKLLRMQGAAGTKSNSELIAGTKKYMKEMDMLAKITGEERAAKEKEREALAQDEQFRAAMAGLGPDVESSVMTLIQSMPNKAMQDFAKDLIANGTATNAANGLLMSQYPALAAQLQRLHQTTQRSVSVTNDDIRGVLAKGKAESENLVRTKQAVSSNVQELGVLATANAGWNKVTLDGIKAAEEQQASAAKTTDGQVEAIEKAKSALAALTNNIMLQLATSGGLDLLMSIFSQLAAFVMNFVLPGLQMLIPILGKIWTGMTMLLQPVIETLSKHFGGMGDTVSTVNGILNEVFSVLNGAVRGAILIFESLMTAIDILSGPFQRLGDAIFGADEGTRTFATTLIDVGDAVGRALEVLAEILGWVIDTAIIPLVHVFQEYLMPPLKALGNFILDNLTPILVLLTAGFIALNAAKIAYTIATIGITGILGILNAGMAILAGAVALATSPFFLIVAAVTGVIYIFKKFGGDLDVVADGLKYMWSGFKTFFSYLKLGFYKVLDALPGIDYGTEIEETQKEISDQQLEREKLATNMSTRMAENRRKDEEEANKKTRNKEEDRAAAHKKALQKQDLAFRSQVPNKLAAGVAPAVGTAVKEELGKPDVKMDYNAGPEALLKAHAEKQGSALTGANTARKTMEVEAERKKEAEAKATAEKQQAAAKAQEASAKAEAEKTGKPGASDSTNSLLTELNNKMAQLLKYQAQTTTNTYETVVAAKGLSKDLFKSI